MRILKIFLRPLCATITLWLLWGCSTKQPDVFQSATDPAQNRAKLLNKDHDGHEYIFTNANVTMWVPSRATPIWDGHTSVVHVDETTPSRALVKDYKIEVEILIVDTPQRLQQMERWASSDWHFQNHPVLSVADAQYGKQMRKDIWNADRTRRLLINAMVFRSATFEEDTKTAKKMVESVKLISK